MSGHSHWATIKRKKGAGDAKRGQIFTRLAREIAMAAREGGGDADSNFRLRIAIDKAKASNMPKDSIQRAVDRGTGTGKDGLTFEEAIYEGIIAKGIAVIVQCVTENRNRTVAEVRHALSKNGGNMGASGAVAWQFTRKAYFSFPLGNNNFDAIFEAALDTGADNCDVEDGIVEITGPVEIFKTMSDALRKMHIQPEEADLRFIPNQETELSVDDTLQVLRAIESVEDLDDVQNVYHNLAITEEAMAKMEAE